MFLGDAKVENLGLALRGHQHVVRFEIPVDQPGRVRCGEASTGEDEDIDDGVPWATRLRFRQPRLEGLTLHEVHGQVQPLLVPTHVEHRNDVGVREACHGLGLPLQAGAVPLHAAVQQLERHLAIQDRVVRSVDNPHAPSAELIDHQIAADGAPHVRHLASAAPPGRLGRGNERLVVGDAHLGSDTTGGPGSSPSGLRRAAAGPR